MLVPVAKSKGLEDAGWGQSAYSIDEAWSFTGGFGWSQTQVPLSGSPHPHPSPCPVSPKRPMSNAQDGSIAPHPTVTERSVIVSLPKMSITFTAIVYRPGLA